MSEVLAHYVVDCRLQVRDLIDSRKRCRVRRQLDFDQGGGLIPGNKSLSGRQRTNCGNGRWIDPQLGQFIRGSAGVGRRRGVRIGEQIEQNRCRQRVEQRLEFGTAALKDAD